MENVTYEYYLAQIYKNPNKNHWRVREFKRKVEEHISGLRLTARKMRGTIVGSFCNREANYYEKQLFNSLEKR